MYLERARLRWERPARSARGPRSLEGRLICEKRSHCDQVERVVGELAVLVRDGVGAIPQDPPVCINLDLAENGAALVRFEEIVSRALRVAFVATAFLPATLVVPHVRNLTRMAWDRTLRQASIRQCLLERAPQ
jgi:hypothetical protein